MQKQKLIDLFEEDLRLNPTTSFVFDLDIDDSESVWGFADYLKDNINKIRGRRGQIVFNLVGNDLDIGLCGVAPMWKEYKDKASFESYYTMSEMMRELFCNERDKNNNLIPFYVVIGGVNYIMTWESNKDTDIFHYRRATAGERGLLNVLAEIFGTIEIKNGEQTYKKLHPCISISVSRKITEHYGFDLGLCKILCDHIKNLGYAVNGETNMSVG